MKTERIERGGGEELETECCSPAHAGASGGCGVTRHFMTKEERREALEAYRDELKKEFTGVEEHLKDTSK
jgi:glutathione S-transferase